MMKAIAWSTGSGSYVAARGPHPVLEQLLERGAADVLHDDVAGALVRHEVVDLDDERVLDLGEELPFGDGRGEGVRVAGVQQALEHHPAVGDVAVAGGVDPAQASVGDGAGDDVLAADDVALLQLGREGERVAAGRAEALGPPRLTIAGAAHGRPARRAGPPLLRHHGVLEDGSRRVDRRHRRDRGQAGAEPGSAQPGRGRADAPGDPAAVGARAGRAERRRGQLVGRPRHGRGRLRHAGRHRGDRGGARRSRRPPLRALRARRPADVAVPVDDRAGAARLGAPGRRRRSAEAVAERRWT